jgi:hypothetical protein
VRVDRQLQSTGTAHPCDWTVMDMRHRSTPVQTCQRYALRCDRVNSAVGVGFWVEPDRMTGPRDAVVDQHAEAWGYLCRYLWTTVDPPARQLLASVVPGKPQPRPIGLAGDQQVDPHLKPLVRPRRGRRTTKKRCGTQREQTVGSTHRGIPNRDIPRYCTTCGQRCGVKGIQGSRTAAQPLKGSATGRGRITEQRRQPGK